MIGIKITTDADKLAARLNDFARKQFPFAVARALTDTAKAARDQITEDLPRIFDRPTPFTRNAVAYTAARRDNLTASVLVKDAQARYLLLQETGGTRTPDKGRALVIPGKSLGLNAYGNIPSGMLKRLRSQAQGGRRRRGRQVVYLPQSAKGSGGYFAEFGNGRLRRLTGFTATEQFKPRFNFKRRVIAFAAANMAARIEKRLAEALATAR
jgi:hypothetical protein